MLDRDLMELLNLSKLRLIVFDNFMNKLIQTKVLILFPCFLGITNLFINYNIFLSVNDTGLISTRRLSCDRFFLLMEFF